MVRKGPSKLQNVKDPNSKKQKHELLASNFAAPRTNNTSFESSILSLFVTVKTRVQ